MPHDPWARRPPLDTPPAAADRPSALLVAAPGPAREQALGALQAAGFGVGTAREPFEATARFVEEPTDLVVVSLARFRRGDVGFLRAVKRRRVGSKVVLLVPGDRRHAALRALEAGADAVVAEPFYDVELTALSQALIGPAGLPRADLGRADRRSLARLASEVAHAVGNPLQVLALLLEDEAVGERARREIDRIRGVLDIVGRFGHLRPPRTESTRLGPLLRTALEAAGDVEPVGKAPGNGPAIDVDPEQVRAAFDDVLAVLVARAADRPVAVAARVARDGEGPWAEALVRAEGVHLPAPELETLVGTVVWSHDQTRRAHPGLARAAAIAETHGGRLVARPGRRGSRLGLRLPL